MVKKGKQDEEGTNEDVEEEPKFEEEESEDEEDAVAETSAGGPDKATGKAKKKDDDEKKKGKEVLLDDVDDIVARLEDEDAKKRKPDLKVFKCIVKDLQLRRLVEKMDPYLKFQLGGFIVKKQDRRHLDEEDKKKEKEKKKKEKMEKKEKDIVKPGKKFRTKKKRNAKKGTSVEYNNKFVRYWVGTYEELEDEYLNIELWDWDLFSRNDYFGEAKIKLIDLATGCIQQHVELKPDLKRTKKGKRRMVAAELDFVCYFQEVFDYKMVFYDWQGNDLHAADYGGTSDPYIEFRILGDWRKFFKKGGYFGRKVKSPTIMNTLYPRWEECGVLQYHGTQSELENEDVFVRVYDWDRLSLDDKIGFTSIPLRGIMDYGYLKSGLARRTNVKDPKTKKNEKKNIPAGGIEGYVRVDDMPAHRQFGDIVTLKREHTYLAVHILNCTDLKDTEAGYSNPFVVAEWDGMKQETKVIEKELSPYFDETLYFPVRVINIDSVEMDGKPPVTLKVHHHGSRGNDFLGSTELPLFAVLMSKAEKIKEFGGSKSRIFKGTVRLQNLGELTSQSLTLRAYFVPDLPKDVVLEEKEREEVAKELPGIYLEREKTWRGALGRLGLLAGREFPIKALDENLIFRFLPSYLTPMRPPRELRDELVLARMIRSITWAEDADIYSGQSDVWTTPNFFLSLRKGDSEDHAILMCNILLGNGVDAYLCWGKSQSGVSGHVCVLVREGDGSVSIWETSTGKRYRLPERWKGLGQTREEAEKVDVDVDELVEWSGRTLKVRKKNLTKKRKTIKKRIRDQKGSKGDARGKKNVVDDDEDGEKIPISELVFYDEDSKLSKRDVLANLMDMDDNAQTFDMDDFAGPAALNLPEVKLPYESFDVIFNHENLWANVANPDPSRVMFDFEDMSTWLPFVTDDSGIPEPMPFYEPRPLGPRMPQTRVKALEKLILNEIKAGYMVWRHKANLEAHFLNDMTPVISEGLGIMERMLVTKPAIVEKIRKRAAEVSQLLVTTENFKKRTDISHELIDLQRQLYKYDFEHWRGKLMGKTPAGHEVEGHPVSFCYTDHKRIRKWVMEKYDYHQDSDEHVKFLLGVWVSPYPNCINSVWVYVGKAWPIVSSV